MRKLRNVHLATGNKSNLVSVRKMHIIGRAERDSENTQGGQRTGS